MDVEYNFRTREQRQKLVKNQFKKYNPIEEFKKFYENYLFQKSFNHLPSTPPESENK